jgi:hypothetical protein
MQIETKFLRLFKPAAVGDRIDSWRVCWMGVGQNRLVLVVMVKSRVALV